MRVGFISAFEKMRTRFLSIENTSRISGFFRFFLVAATENNGRPNPEMIVVPRKLRRFII
jgi:hypothetical protein